MTKTSRSLAMLFAMALLGSPASADDSPGFDWLDYDANGDGSLSGDEIDAARGGRNDARQERREGRLDRFDTDGDGALSHDERSAARDARDARHQEQRQKALDRFDADGDGRLTGDERRSARDARQTRRNERGQQQGRGARAGGPRSGEPGQDGRRGQAGPGGGGRHRR